MHDFGSVDPGFRKHHGDAERWFGRTLGLQLLSCAKHGLCTWLFNALWEIKKSIWKAGGCSHLLRLPLLARVFGSAPVSPRKMRRAILKAIYTFCDTKELCRGGSAAKYACTPEPWWIRSCCNVLCSLCFCFEAVQRLWAAVCQSFWRQYFLKEVGLIKQQI